MKRWLIFLFMMSRLMSYGQHPYIKIEVKGLRVDSAFFSVAEKKVDENVFPIGTNVYLNLINVLGFATKDGKSRVGCSMKVTDEKKNVMVEYKDLFQDAKEGISSDDARYLNMNLTIGAPMEENHAYDWEIRVWDKVTQSELTARAVIKVSGAVDHLGIRKKAQGLTVSNVFVLGEAPLKTNQVHEREKLTMVFSGLKGFALNAEKKITLGAQVIVKDQNQNNIIEMTDLFKEQSVYDVSLSETLRLNITIGDPMLPGNTYIWTIKVWDKISNKSLEAAVDLEVVE